MNLSIGCFEQIDMITHTFKRIITMCIHEQRPFLGKKILPFLMCRDVKVSYNKNNENYKIQFKQRVRPFTIHYKFVITRDKLNCIIDNVHSNMDVLLSTVEHEEQGEE